ncbi:MAG TPA: NUDIX domain-containing protein [Microbacterium sp.]|jgi:8-oxo-dGTP pyrophosphatase MutT (NUDIX family)|nr:NUDIX domain-containing protein [Microbacterium sp.]
MRAESTAAAPDRPERVRAALIDAEGRLVLIRRDRPGRQPYWVLPGGGVEPSDASPVEALTRELHEELGAEAEIGERMLVIPASARGGEQWVYRAALGTIDPALRSGPEFADPSRGRYTVQRIDPRDLHAVNLLPEEARRRLIDDISEKPCPS